MDSALSPGWPEEGAVGFSGYRTRYRPGLDLVLRDLDLELRPGEKVGVCGRTGAGKSSLTMALFRIMEAAGGRVSRTKRSHHNAVFKTTFIKSFSVYVHLGKKVHWHISLTSP